MKKLGLIFIIVTMVLVSSLTFADEKTVEDAYNDGYDDGYNAGKNSAKAKTPLVKIKQSEDIPEVEPGAIIEFKLRFKNESNDKAMSLHITPQIEDNKALIYERPLEYATTVALKANSEGTCTFKIRTSEEAKMGTYALKLKLEYKNASNEVFTRDDVTYFKIITEKSKPIINVSNIVLSSQNLKYGDRFIASFDISNIGESDAKDVELKLEGFTDSGIMPLDSKDYSYLGTIEGRNTVNQKFNFVISDDIETKDNTITATITYKGFDDKEYTASKKIYITGVKLKPKSSGDKETDNDDVKYAKPKTIISSYSINPNNLVAGDDFTFSFTFKNTSREKAIRNVKVTVSSKEGCFIITRGSNTFYIESVGASQSVSKKIDLKAKQDLTSNSYELNLNFEYEDYNGAEYNSIETINIPVTEYSKLVINGINISEGYVGQPSSLSFDYVNMGKATISNLQASVEGDFEGVQEQNYIGNIQAGNSDYYDIEVKPTKEGINVGTLILSFEDSSGRVNSVKKEFQGEAFTEEIPTDIDMPIGEDIPAPEEQGTTFETWQIVLSGIGTLLVSFVLTFIITKKILMKKFEEDI
ncbi:MAG: hypothetical protein IKI57_02210 [Clostridia bacterium]|nr:hypothetical protein [Clostridia bacterium]